MFDVQENEVIEVPELVSNSEFESFSDKEEETINSLLLHYDCGTLSVTDIKNTASLLFSEKKKNIVLDIVFRYVG